MTTPSFGKTYTPVTLPMTAVSRIDAKLWSGDDTFTCDPRVWTPVTVDGGKGNDTLSGGAGADALTGGDGHDEPLGQGGKDKLYGGDGSDTLRDGAGDDYLFGGPDRYGDHMYGGTGKDTFEIEVFYTTWDEPFWCQDFPIDNTEADGDVVIESYQLW